MADEFCSVTFYSMHSTGKHPSHHLKYRGDTQLAAPAIPPQVSRLESCPGFSLSKSSFLLRRPVAGPGRPTRLGASRPGGRPGNELSALGFLPPGPSADASYLQREPAAARSLCL